MKKSILLMALLVCFTASPVLAGVQDTYPVGKLKPIDSESKLKVGDMAPDFTLPAVGGGNIRLSDYRGKKNVVISFVPAAWTPVCSDQWPGYNIAQELFEQQDAVLLGVSVDNLPSQNAWSIAMGKITFPILSDFWPHGAVAQKYGIFRSTGISERALFVIDKKGVIRYMDVHDINNRPDLGVLIGELKKLR